MKVLRNTIFTIFVLISLGFTNSLTLTNVDTVAGTVDVVMTNDADVGYSWLFVY